MKNLRAIAALALLTAATSSFACDEQCKQDQLNPNDQTNFPSYLSKRYCSELKLDFMTKDMQSMQSYSRDHFGTQYKGPIKNMVSFIDQRENWLKECDDYLHIKHGEHIFTDQETNTKIFTSIDSVRNELKAIIDGKTYSEFTGEDTKTVVGSKFEGLFQLVDNHKNLMYLRGKYVYK